MYASNTILLHDDDDITAHAVSSDAEPFVVIYSGTRSPAGSSISISAYGETPADTIQRFIDALTKLRGMVIAKHGGDPVADMGPLEARAMDGDR